MAEPILNAPGVVAGIGQGKPQGRLMLTSAALKPEQARQP